MDPLERAILTVRIRLTTQSPRVPPPQCIAFCTVRVQMPGVLDVTTSIIKKNLSPVWDEAVYVATFPGSDNLVELTVMDSDAGVIVNGSDDFLGSARLNLTQVGSSWTEMTIPLTGPKAKGALRVMTKAYTADPTLTIVRCSSLRNADGAFGTRSSLPLCPISSLGPVLTPLPCMPVIPVILFVWSRDLSLAWSGDGLRSCRTT